jgi:uncharacterized integral membrane protein
MKIIKTIVLVVLFLMLLWLAMQNTNEVTFSMADTIRIPAPLIVFLFGFFALGLLVGVAILLPKNWGLRWDVRKLRKENEQQKALLAQHGVITEPVVDVPLVM